LATKPILLIRSAGTKLISHVFAYGVSHLWESTVGPATSDVIVPSIHTDARVTECQAHNVGCASPLTFAWRETTSGSHVTSWITMHEPPMYLMLANMLNMCFIR